MDYLTSSGHVVLLDDDTALPPGKISIGSHGYAQFWNGKTVVLLHRWLLGATGGDGLVADHINRDRLDNRRENLRLLTPAQSNLNRAVSDNPRWAYPCRGKWQARVKRNGKQYHLGTFGTEMEAHEAARRWATKFDSQTP